MVNKERNPSTVRIIIIGTILSLIILAVVECNIDQSDFSSPVHMIFGVCSAVAGIIIAAILEFKVIARQ